MIHARARTRSFKTMTGAVEAVRGLTRDAGELFSTPVLWGALVAVEVSGLAVGAATISKASL